jgi:integrase
MTSNHPESSGKQTERVFDKVGENLYRHRPSKGYYGLLKRGGKQFRRSLKTTDRALATRRLAELRQQVGNLTTSDDARLPFPKIAKLWMQATSHTLKPASILRRETCIANLKPYFKGATIRNILPSHCDKWLTDRGQGIAPQTFAHELGTMKAIFNFAVERGLLLSNPARHIKRKKIPAAEIRVPSRTEFQQLINAMRDPERKFGTQGKGQDAADLVELMAYTGCRQAEATALRWTGVDLKAGTLTINGTKTDSSRRIIPVTDALRTLLERLRAARKPAAGDTIAAIADAKRCLQTTCRKLELPTFTHHDFRHFFATTCIESGVDIPTISRWLGHKDGGALAMKVYGHLRPEHSFAQIKKVCFTPAQELTSAV